MLYFLFLKAEVYFGMQEINGGLEVDDDAVTPVALRAPSITASKQNRLHLISNIQWS